jgi:hypothetical protein
MFGYSRHVPCSHGKTDQPRSLRRLLDENRYRHDEAKDIHPVPKPSRSTAHNSTILPCVLLITRVIPMALSSWNDGMTGAFLDQGIAV